MQFVKPFLFAIPKRGHFRPIHLRPDALSPNIGSSAIAVAIFAQQSAAARVLCALIAAEQRN
jgi:ABC-type uncharacterized transport system permease subunit